MNRPLRSFLLAQSLAVLCALLVAPLAWPESAPAPAPESSTAPAALAPAAAAVGGVGSGARSKRADVEQSSIRVVRDQRADMRSSYRNALGRLAEGDRVAAVRELSQMEERYGKPRKMAKDGGDLWKIQADMIQKLSANDPELLVPILMLHLDASEDYRKRRVWFLANHSGKMAQALAEIYAKEGGGRGAQVVAGRALTSLGGQLQQDMTTEFCRCVPVYERALDHYPENEAALLGLAFVAEKAGRYGDAVKHLRRLLEVNPKNLEAHLRLALNLKRTGRLARAEKELFAVKDQPEPAWAVSLAYQELARLYMNLGNDSKADLVLREGREKFPSDQRLVVQQAFLWETMRRPAQALALLEEVRANKTALGESPRNRYNQMPRELLAATQEELWQGAESRLTLLKDALEGLEGAKR